MFTVPQGWGGNVLTEAPILMRCLTCFGSTTRLPHLGPSSTNTSLTNKVLHTAWPPATCSFPEWPRMYFPQVSHNRQGVSSRLEPWRHQWTVCVDGPSKWPLQDRCPSLNDRVRVERYTRLWCLPEPVPKNRAIAQPGWRFPLRAMAKIVPLRTTWWSKSTIQCTSHSMLSPYKSGQVPFSKLMLRSWAQRNYGIKRKGKEAYWRWFMVMRANLDKLFRKAEKSGRATRSSTTFLALKSVSHI